MCASSIFIYIPYIMFQTWYNWASQLKNHFIFSFLCSFSWESILTKINLTNWISLPFHPDPKKRKKKKKSYLTWHLESERIAIIFTSYREGNQGPDLDSEFTNIRMMLDSKLEKVVHVQFVYIVLPLNVYKTLTTWLDNNGSDLCISCWTNQLHFLLWLSSQSTRNAPYGAWLGNN